MDQSEFLQGISQAIIDGDESAAKVRTEAALAASLDPMLALQKGVQGGLNRVGEMFEAGDCYLPELIMAGDAARAAISVLMPHISAADQNAARRGKVVIGSTSGDLHDIGKNIVSALLSAQGFEVVDLGTDVSSKKFVEAAQNHRADIIAVSTLLTTSLAFTRELVRLLNDTKVRDKHFVIVGGGPVTPEWVKSIGADGYGRDANNAVTLCSQLLSGTQRPPLKEPVCIGALR
jgi:corrinoid protein of di/trimethylamine methyltransferase